MELKKLFRKKKRLYMKLKSNRNLQKISKYFTYDKDGFWHAINKLQKKNNTINAPINKLKDHYHDLFNNKNDIIPGNNENSDKELSDIVNMKHKDKFEYTINLNKVAEILHELPNNRSPADDGLSYEHYKHCNSMIFIEYIKFLIETMFQYSITPTGFNMATIKPLIKDKEKPDDPTNTRPVAVSHPMNNIFERVSLNEVQKDFVDEPEQFGFRSNSSCSHSIFMVKQVIEICRSRKQVCFICALDASKAFDKLVRSKLWLKMFQLGIRPVIIFALMSYYGESFMIIVNGSDYSIVFISTNSVKQGGVISPKLYTIYTTFMIRLMKLLLIGIRIGKLLICIIVYADDTLLLANKKEDMQRLLDEIGKLGNEDDILFNGKKSAILIFNKQDTKQDNIIFKLNHETIPIVESVRYLGYQLNVHNNNYAHILQRKNKTYAAVNKLRSFGLINHNVSPTTRAFLFKTFVRPVLHYGIDNSHLDVNEFNLIKKIESTVFKMMLCINKQCHNTTL
jgi:hypothetical protein